MSGTSATAGVTELAGLMEVGQDSKSTRSGKDVGRGGVVALSWLQNRQYLAVAVT